MLCFGSVPDITGFDAEILDSPDNTLDLNNRLIERFPALSAVNYRFSVNHRLVSGNTPLADGDEVSLLPPFAGG